MTDLSKLSDDELKALYTQSVQPKSLTDMSDDELMAAYKEQPSMIEDVAKSAGIGAVEGTLSLADLPDIAGNAGKYVGNKLGNMITGKNKPFEANEPSWYSGQNIQKQIEDNVTGKFYEPKTTAGEYAKTIGSFAPAAFGGEGNALLKLGKYAVVPGLASEGAGQYTKGTSAEPYARVAGALVGGAIPSIARRAVTPFPSSPERQKLVEALSNEGVTSLTAGQKTGSPNLQRIEGYYNSPVTGMAANRISEEGQNQFTNAAMKRAGSEGLATPENLQANQERLGNQFKDLSSRNTLTPDKKMASDILDTVNNYQGGTLASEQKDRIYSFVSDIVDKMKQGSISGELYQNTRSKLGKLAEQTKNTDATFSSALKDLQKNLDEGMARSLSPEDKALWDQTNKEYSSQKLNEKSSATIGEDAVEGQISSKKYASADARGNKSRSSRGKTPNSDLARAGQVLEKINKPINEAPNILQMAATPINAIVGNPLMSRPGQAYLGNQIMKGKKAGSAGYAAVINALMASQHQQGAR